MVKETYKKISSLQNPIVKYLIKLKDNKTYRGTEQCAVIMGCKSVDQISSKYKPIMILAPDPVFFKHENWFDNSTEFYLTSYEIVKKISGFNSFNEIIAVFSMPKPESLHEKKFILAFDEITDPGNLGTLVRTALALNWEGIFLLPDCCDLFNDKTLRASKGGSFLLPFQYGSHEELMALCSQMDAPLLIGDLGGQDLAKCSSLTKGILLLSNEAHGVKPKIKSFGKKITIPLSPYMESLNVSAAGAILMYELKKP